MQFLDVDEPDNEVLEAVHAALVKQYLALEDERVSARIERCLRLSDIQHREGHFLLGPIEVRHVPKDYSLFYRFFVLQFSANFLLFHVCELEQALLERGLLEKLLVLQLLPDAFDIEVAVEDQVIVRVGSHENEVEFEPESVRGNLHVEVAGEPVAQLIDKVGID